MRTSVSPSAASRSEALTGGCSSFSDSVRSGRADRLAKTPSVPTPPPMTLGRELDDVVLGEMVACPSNASRCGPEPLLMDGLDGVALCRTSRCLSSGSSSSLASSVSNASARSGSTGPRRVGEEARERKDGGGELGMAAWCSLGWGEESTPSLSSLTSSWAFTCSEMRQRWRRAGSCDSALHTLAYRPDMVMDAAVDMSI